MQCTHVHTHTSQPQHSHKFSAVYLISIISTYNNNNNKYVKHSNVST